MLLYKHILVSFYFFGFCQDLQGIKGTTIQCTCENMEEIKLQIRELQNHRKVPSCGQAYWLPYESLTVAEIYPFGVDGKSVKTMCDMKGPGSGWTVIQRRYDGSQDFYKNWEDYKNGFGNPNEEFWIGLDVIHRLTAPGDKILRVELEDFDGNSISAEYSTFIVGSESDSYRLRVSGYSGSAGDGLGGTTLGCCTDQVHNSMIFSTKDVENNNRGFSCAQEYHGAWWYNHCHISNLNGFYKSTKTTDASSMTWYAWKSKYESLKSSKMMIRNK